MSKKLIAVSLLCISSLTLTSCKPNEAPFEPKDWVGFYEIIDQKCATDFYFSDPNGIRENVRYVTIEYKIAADSNPKWKDLLTITDRTELGPKSLQRTSPYYNVNGEGFISSNSCWSDGLIFRTTVLATGTTLTRVTDQLKSGLLCLPTDVIQSSREEKLAERHGDMLTIYGCAFGKMSAAAAPSEAN